MGLGVGVLDVFFRERVRGQMILEGLLCGLITLALVPLVEYFGLPQSMATFIGGACGFIGTEKLRDLAIRWGEKKASA